ncbi:sugar phosphate isomerase/epimerase family protein [Kineococcus rhizosphaerae]|uniref:Sugar phosphate isomerase/epimerase n=1 Tax=Kineococcus rhizosphaerae TaxID=559628 RepID=A0A2T0R296_9ACTN|nr:sugar phosphate isomerase/epimerase family protein [Kineococcus rhizosphaerae]PRY13904.1 sugar phosphate isomerase/epimerase [Kineococcus rhizosphaerae]
MPETSLPSPTSHARLAYNANGLRSVSLDDAVRTLADRGYDGIELSLNAQHVDPWTFSAADAAHLRETLAETGMVACSLATGDPHLLSEHAFEPALVDPDPAERARRLDLLQRGVRTGVLIGVPLVVFSTGKRRPEVSEAQADAWLDEALAVLLDTLHETLDAAGLPRGSTVLAIEPEPGFHCRTNADVAAVLERTGSTDLWLSQDLGHCVVEEEDALGSLARHLPVTRHLQVEDIAGRVHAHLVPGDGDVDFDAVGRVLADGYDGWISVELYDHDPVHREAARRSEEFLRDRFPSLTRSSDAIDLTVLEERSTTAVH